MRWTWDIRKSEATAIDRGFNFAFVVQVFAGAVHLVPADRNGERRWQAIGVIEGRFYSVIYTRRNEDGVRVRRIISARRARHNEIQAYKDRFDR